MLPIVVLARPDDRLALEVLVKLRARNGPRAARIVCDEELVFASRWTHRVDQRFVETVVELQEGDPIDSRNLAAVFNRLRAVPMNAFAGTPEPDRSYAIAETHALWLSWLAGLPCPVLNPPTPRGLSCPEIGELEWLVRAARAGLPVRGHQLTTNARRFRAKHLELLAAPGWNVDDSMPVSQHVLGAGPAMFGEPTDAEAVARVLVAGDAVVGEPAQLWCKPLRILARNVHCDLLEVVAAPRHGGDRADPSAWRFCGASGFVQNSSPDRVAAVVQALERRAARGVEMAS